MKIRVVVGFLLGFVLSVCLGQGLQASSQAEDLFQRGLMKESGERNLEAAIDLYQQAIAQPGVDHMVIIEARFRMGSCYERLGQTQNAEKVYLQILADATAPPSEIYRETQSNLRRLEAQNRQAAQTPAPDEMASRAKAEPEARIVHEIQPTRASLSLGPGFLLTKNNSSTRLAVALRYRVSEEKRPLAIYVEMAALTPSGDSAIYEETKAADQQTTDSGKLSMHYQVSAAVVAELPHGVQRTLIPEMGVGLAITDADIQVNSEKVSQRTMSPALSAGLHVFPDRALSLLLQGTFTQNPFPQSIELASPPHSQTFDVPSALWAVTAKIQFKINWFRREVEHRS